MSTRKSSLEIKGSVKKYLSKGLRQSEIAKLLGLSRQNINYWVQMIRKEEVIDGNPS